MIGNTNASIVIQSGGGGDDANEFTLLLTGNYNYMTEEVCKNIIEGNYKYVIGG